MDRRDRGGRWIGEGWGIGRMEKNMLMVVDTPLGMCLRLAFSIMGKYITFYFLRWLDFVMKCEGLGRRFVFKNWSIIYSLS